MAKIDLVKNFRSREEVLSSINLLFDLFMDDAIGGADYKASHRMVFGNISYNEEGKTSQDYNLDVLTYTPAVGTNITKDELPNDILPSFLIHPSPSKKPLIKCFTK